MINVSPLIDPASIDFSDPRVKYIPPDNKIGRDPLIYAHNLCMLVLEANCPPSPTGLYSCCEIAPQWAPWLRAHQGFDKIAHIEERPCTLTGEVRFYLWRLKDWVQVAQAQEAKAEDSRKFSVEWWEKRYRMWRGVCHMYDTMNRVGWETAKGTVLQWIQLYENREIPDGIKEPIASLLGTVAKWFEPINPDELEEFRFQWRSKHGHLYASPYDITSEED